MDSALVPRFVSAPVVSPQSSSKYLHMHIYYTCIHYENIIINFRLSMRTLMTSLLLQLEVKERNPKRYVNSLIHNDSCMQLHHGSTIILYDYCMHVQYV